MKTDKKLVVMGALLLTLTLASLAQAKTTFTLGAGGAYGPDYNGSDDYEFSALPLIGIEWESEKPTGQGFDFGLHGIALGTLDGLQIETLRFQKGNHRLGVKIGLGYEFGRDEDDNGALRGLDDIDPYVTGILKLSYGPAEMRRKHYITGEVALEGDLSGETDSLTVSAEVKANHAIGGKTIISHGPHAIWANDDHMQAYFGIDSKQAANSVYDVYRADSGIQDVGYSITTKYRLTDHIGLMVSGKYDRLVSDAADSPLVDQEGSDDQYTILTGVSYRF